MKAMKRALIALLIVVFQAYVTWFAMTVIVSAKGEARAARPAQIAEEQPFVFWSVLLGAVLLNNFVLFLFLKLRAPAAVYPAETRKEEESRTSS